MSVVATSFDRGPLPYGSVFKVGAGPLTELLFLDTYKLSTLEWSIDIKEGLQWCT